MDEVLSLKDKSVGRVRTEIELCRREIKQVTHALDKGSLFRENASQNLSCVMPAGSVLGHDSLDLDDGTCDSMIARKHLIHIQRVWGDV